MRFLKALLAILGLVGVVAGAVFLFQSWIDIRSLVAVANANKNQGFGIASPFPKVGLAAGVGALGALVLGLGLAMPRITEGGIRKQVLESQRAGLNREIDAAEFRAEHGKHADDARAERHDHAAGSHGAGAVEGEAR